MRITHFLVLGAVLLAGVVFAGFFRSLPLISSLPQM